MFGQRGRMNGRLWAIAAIFALGGAALTGRVAYVQLANADHYRAVANNEHFGQQVVRADRGAILDRNGYPLATTVDAFDVYINRADWENLDDARKAAATIAPVIGVKPEDLVNEARKESKGLYLAYGGLDFTKGSALRSPRRKRPSSLRGSSRIGAS